MKESNHLHANLPEGMENETRRFFLNFAVSFICHLIFFVILIFAPGYATDRKPSISVINVNLITLPDQEKVPSSDDQQPGDKSRVADQKIAKISSKSIPETVQKPKEAISVGPKKKKIKQSLKKKTFNYSKMVKSAISRIEKKVEKSRPDQITQAIERLKQQIKDTDGVDSREYTDLRGSEDASKKVLELIDIYRVEIAYQVQKNWAFSDQLTGGVKDLEAWVAIKIIPNGEIKDIWFDKRSGNSYFDEAAEKAILKSNPLPPFPKGYLRSSYVVGFHFTPSGVK
jgi:colicin import membrane protein